MDTPFKEPQDVSLNGNQIPTTFKYSFLDDKSKAFDSSISFLFKIGQDQPAFGVSFARIHSAYELVNFFFTLLGAQRSNGRGFYGNRNIIVRNIEKVHLLVYSLDEEKYYPDEWPKFTDLVPLGEYESLVFTDSPNSSRFVLLGWTMLTDHSKYFKMHFFDTFLGKHNFGELLWMKLPDEKNTYITDPISDFLDYWAEHDWMCMFDSWCRDFNASEEEKWNLENPRFIEFLTKELQWSNEAVQHFLTWYKKG